ncbi:MAG TPA: TrkA family potassium uptake protein [Acidimicrobiales bacterium]|nr:TrkA family potassium uptake protein [Acidimicrobiales bacterium]
MKVSIAGGGVVGRSIARDLVRNDHEVLIVEQDPAVVRRQMELESDPESPESAIGPGVRWFAGDACEVSTLHEAGFGEADVVVAATGDDEDNLVVSLLSKQEFAVPRVIARVNHPKNEWLFNETWGVDVSVSTPHLITALVEEALSVGTLVRLLHFAEGKAGLVEVTLADDSPAASKPLAELGMPRDSSVVAVIRERRVVVPRGDTVLDQGDEVIVLVTEDSEDAVRRILVG